jgi:F0F1-type ATP synthase membrane subunit b/b'
MKRYRSYRSNAGASNIRRWRVAGVAGVAVALVGVGLGVAAAADSAVPTVNCQTVADKIGAVPAQAQAEIARNLQLLNTQIQEANNRIRTSQGQGGPNFIQNAILGPLKDKRFATINRMETAIGRTLAKPNLNAEGLAPCTLNANGGGNASPEPAQVPAKSVQAGAAAVANVGTISCPDVRINVAIPAQAQAEIDRNLALLQTQINEANARLKSSVGQGGANFVQNAILGPLKDKRFATINRMETAIGRNAAKPNLNAEGLSTCSVSAAAGGGGAAATPTAAPTTAAPVNNGGNNNAGVNDGTATVNCPAVVINVAIPAQAQAEIDRNLALLQTQINEANARIKSSVGQGGANFIQNAILGPLEDKRFATINRMETAIGRNAAKPNLNAEGLAPCSLNQ